MKTRKKDERIEKVADRRVQGAKRETKGISQAESVDERVGKRGAEGPKAGGSFFISKDRS
jgi:hypothetical protein